MAPSPSPPPPPPLTVPRSSPIRVFRTLLQASVLLPEFLCPPPPPSLVHSFCFSVLGQGDQSTLISSYKNPRATYEAIGIQPPSVHPPTPPLFLRTGQSLPCRASTGLLLFSTQFLLRTHIAEPPATASIGPGCAIVAHLAPKMSTRKRKQEAEDEEELLELPDESEEEEE